MTPAKVPAGPLDPLWRALRALRAACTIALWLVVAPSGVLPYAVLCCVHRNGPRKAELLQRAAARGVRILHWWLRTLRIVHFDWRRVRLDLPEGACVVVANHPTQLDPTVLMAVLGQASTIVKPSVYRRRFVHGLLAGAGHFEGPSPDPGSVGRVVDAAVERLRRGQRLFVFPEAKRSPEGGLREFGRLAFEIACRAGVPVVSIALRCEPCYLSRETPLFRPPARLSRVFVETLAIDAPGSCGGDSRLLKQRVERRYLQWVEAGMPPLATPAGGSSAASPSPDDRPSRSSMRPALRS